MSENRGLQIGQGSAPAFVEAQMQSLEGAMLYANALLKSKMCPAHFYEKKKEATSSGYEKWVPDYEKGKPEAVLMVLQHGREIGLSYMQSLQQIVPVNGLVAIKGDGAKSLIMGSGKCESWTEEYIGTPYENNYGCRITAKRKDTGEVKTIIFTVEQAKRAGLWVTDEMASKTAALKYGGWYKYPDRMVRYRALGFIARDLFADVLLGTFIEEEAKDIDVDNTIVKLEDGMTVDHGKIDKAAALTEGAKKKNTKGLHEKVIPLTPNGSMDVAPETKPAEEKKEPASANTPEEKTEAAETKENPITDGMMNLKGPDLWKRLTDNWPKAGIDPLSLYDTEKNPRTPPKVRALLQAIADGMLEKHLSDKYGVTVGHENAAGHKLEAPESAPAPKNKVTLPDFVTEPGEGRDMMAASKLCTFLEDKVSEARILEIHSDSFNDADDFYTNATIDQIKSVLQ